MTLGPWELIVILLIVVVIFGAGRLSDVGGAMGKSVHAFRKAASDETPSHPGPAARPDTSAVIPVVVVENKCPSCATVNPAGQAFCGQCGTRLTLAA